MSWLTEFERDLRALVADRPNLRPFVCQGSPEECRVFIVGINPATAMADDFWAYWQPDFGYDKSAWLSDYEAHRIAQGKRARSNTRMRLDRIQEAAPYVNILETNIYAYAASSPSQIPNSERRTDLFAFLLEKVKPDAVLAHGVKVARELDKLGIPYLPYSDRHLRFWKYERATEVGRELDRAFGSRP